MFFTKNKKIRSAQSVAGQPESAQKLVNKYGTYNIQPTNDSENRFPYIQQGKSKKDKP